MSDPIQLGDPRWHTHCKVCERTQNDPPVGAQPRFNYSAGQYHAGACYDTLFGICEVCGQKNMSVLSNLNSWLPECRAPLCDSCHQMRFKWHIARISAVISSFHNEAALDSGARAW